MVHGFLSGDALLGILLKKFLYQIFAVLGNVVKLGRSPMPFVSHDIFDSQSLCFLFEWQVTRYHLVEYNPEGPHIRGSRCAALEYLRRSVIWISDKSRSVHAVLVCRKAEIDQADVIVFRQHNVCWVDVSVDHVARVTVTHGSQ